MSIQTHSKFLISSKNSPLKPSSSKVSIPLPPDVILLSQTSFPSDKEFKKHLKLFKKKASETLSQFFYSGSNDDTTSSSFLGDVNEDMCYGRDTHPWVDASKTSSNYVFKVLQKQQIRLPVKSSLCDSAYDVIARDMGYSRPSL